MFDDAMELFRKPFSNFSRSFVSSEERPTRRQIEYAFCLGITNPKRKTRRQLLRELERAYFEAERPTERDLRAAARLGVAVSEEWLRHQLMETIWQSVRSGPTEDMTAWFTYRVLRGFACGGPDEPDFSGVDYPAVRVIARQLTRNAEVLDSVRSYSSLDLRFFDPPVVPPEFEEGPYDERMLAYRIATYLIADLYGIADPNR